MQQIHNYWSSLPFFNDIQLTACALGRVTAQGQRDWSFPNFTASFDKLYFLEAGSLTAEILDKNNRVCKQYTLTAGNVYLIPCGNRYNLYTEPGFTKHFLHLNVLLHDGFDLFYGVEEILYAPWSADACLQRLDEGLSKQDPTAIFSLKGYAYAALTAILQNGNENLLSKRFYAASQYPELLLAALKTIRSQIRATLTVSMVANTCGISAQSLEKLFSQYMNTSPKQYMKTLLWERASGMLLGSTLSLKQIAAELQFSDQYAFSKFFKKYCSLSPSCYRRFRLEGQPGGLEG